MFTVFAIICVFMAFISMCIIIYLFHEMSVGWVPMIFLLLSLGMSATFVMAIEHHASEKIEKIEACQSELKRTEQCKIIAVPIKKDDL